jgi:hypothetical protein
MKIMAMQGKWGVSKERKRIDPTQYEVLKWTHFPPSLAALHHSAWLQGQPSFNEPTISDPWQTRFDLALTKPPFSGSSNVIG